MLRKGDWRIGVVMDNGERFIIGAYDSYEEALEAMNGYKEAIASDVPFIGGDDLVVSTHHISVLMIQATYLQARSIPMDMDRNDGE